MTKRSDSRDAPEPRQPSENQRWSTELIRACMAFGADEFFVAPGSRSTPLASAIARAQGATCRTHFDERGLAFACLGFARGSEKVPVFLCTSGTAVANALPAVIEAAADQIPLLLLTADRPPELRDCGANQAIRQPGIFGSYVRWSFDFPCPTPDVPIRWIGSTVAHALDMAADGPVHLNCMFREPLARWVEPAAGGSPPDALPPLPRTADSLRVPRDAVPVHGGRTIVIVGRCLPREARAARQLAAQWRAVFLADATSGLHDVPFDLAIGRQELPHPETVIHVGGRITSSKWHQYVSEFPPPHYLHLSPHAPRIDPHHVRTITLRCEIEPGLAAITLTHPCPDDFSIPWNSTLTRTCDVLQRYFAESSELSEPSVAYDLTSRLPSGHAVLLGNSMPIRDVETFGRWPEGTDVCIGANRGASGIDGTIASAVGLALGSGRPTIALVGDLAFLHDLNSLAMVRTCPIPIQIVLLNNNGGGIFHFLPVAETHSHFESLFAMPHELDDFRAAADLFGLAYERPVTREDFQRTLDRWNRDGERGILEVQTDRRQNAELHRHLEALVRNVAC